MKTDQELCQEIERELEWDPSARCERVTVEVHQGAVTLHGVVAVYSERVAAERAALRIGGVVDVTNEIELQPVVADDPDDDGHRRGVPAQARDARRAAAADRPGQRGRALAHAQRRPGDVGAARRGAARGAQCGWHPWPDRPAVGPGRPTVGSRGSGTDPSAFERHGCSTEHLPQVRLTGRVVTLVGQVPSDEERFLALEAARFVDGIHTVRNCLDVEPSAR